MSLKRKPPAGSVRRPQVKGTNLRGVFTNKANHSIGFESEAEHALILRLDRDPQIRDYGTWPSTFLVPSLDAPVKLQAYTPQCMVWRYDDIVEIHHVRRVVGSSRTKNDELGQHLCETKGWRYVSHQAEALTTGSSFANLLALVRYRPSAYAQPNVTSLVLAHLLPGYQYKFHDVVADIAPQLDLAKPVVLAALCYLLWHGVVYTDLECLLFLHGTIARHIKIGLPPQPQVVV